MSVAVDLAKALEKAYEDKSLTEMEMACGEGVNPFDESRARLDGAERRRLGDTAVPASTALGAPNRPIQGLKAPLTS